MTCIPPLSPEGEGRSQGYFQPKVCRMNGLSIGSIVRCRNREWVILPSPDENLILLRPLTGSDRTCGGGAGVNGNYLSHPSNSVISSGLAIGFTDTVVIISRNRHRRPRASQLLYRLVCLGMAPNLHLPLPLSRLISLCTNVIYIWRARVDSQR